MLMLKSQLLVVVQIKMMQNMHVHEFVDTTPVRMAFKMYESPYSRRDTPPLMIMHGIFGGKDNWHHVATKISKESVRRIYCMDARNHGDSPYVPDHSTELVADDIIELMRIERLQKIIGMGHSMGGRAIMALALKYPERVERAIVIDMSPLATVKEFGWIQDLFDTLDLIEIPKELSLEEGRNLVRKALEEKEILFKESTDLILKNLVKRDDKTGEFKWNINIEALYENFRDFTHFHERIAKYPPYQGPVLFICGKRSTFVRPENWPEMQKQFPNAKLQWLNTGHYIHYDQPEKFVKIVLDFLK